MKKLILSLALVGIFSFSFGQKVQVSEGNENINDGNHPCLIVTIFGGDVKDVEKDMKDFLKDMKGKVQVKKEIFADDCELKEMGDNTFDVYARIEEVKDEGAKVIMAVDLGGAYMSSSQHGEQYKFIKDRFYKFAVKATKNVIGNELKDEEKALSDLEGEQKDLEKENEKLHDDIEDYKKKIEEAEKAIEDNEKKQDEKKGEIEEQKAVVKAVQQKLDGVK